MPGLIKNSGPALESPYFSGPGSSEDSALQDEYPAINFPGYSEKPLEEQLEPIAVVGMGCRLPGDVSSPAGFWEMMMNKRSGNSTKVPSSRFNIDAHFHKNNDRPGSFGVLGGYFLDGDLTEFDPALFNITPIEAMWMDPQQRKLLEVVYEALESGGITLEAVSGTRTAVFAACFTADWQQMSFKEPSFRHSLSATGVDPGIISNRISHVFNLNGPSILCNTACSSSVYALHNACNALRNREAEAAIVGGVNLIITVDQHMNTAKLGVLSPTSTCHTFDKSADGYGRAEAVGAVYLKRLSDAVRDGDPIRGVIRSSATNSNGRVPAVGITYPNRDGQADVISHAYRRGGDLDPRLTGYFECHGTGTPVGDPIEVEAVAMAMNKARKLGEDDALWIGAVKTNIGHSEAASGLSALIKAVLMVERGILVPTKGLVEPNPNIKWHDWQVKVVTEPTPFPEHLPVRRVSINSFGYGGTNAHIIVEASESIVKTEQRYKYFDGTPGSQPRPAPRRTVHRRRPFLLPFSAHDKATLLRNIDAHGKVVANYSLIDLSHTLATRRSVLSSKAFAVVSYDTVDEVFNDTTASFTFAEKKNTKTPTLGFVFTGQGAQWARMGAELLENSPCFLAAIRDLDAALEDLQDGPAWSIEDVLLEHAESSPVSEAEFSQPLCTAVQIALVQLLESWGVTPAVTVGHSSGEMAAAYAAGLLSAKEAIILAYYRGLVTRNVGEKGAMMAVGLGAEAVAPYLEHDDFRDRVVVACENSPSSVTLSGDADALDTIHDVLSRDGVFVRTVKTGGKAYHSHHMAPVAERYEKLVKNAKRYKSWKDMALAKTRAKMVSSVTTAIFSPGRDVLDETYWSQNLRSPVLFNQAVQTILKEDEFADVNLFVEIGPHSAMKGPIQQIKKELMSTKVDYLPSLLRGTDSAVQLMHLAGELFLRGCSIDAKNVASAYVDETAAARASVIVDLPPYQWNYARPFWAESRASHEQRAPKFPRHDVLGQQVIGNSLAEPTWRNVLRIRDLPWLKDHCLGGEVVFPAAGYFAMAMEAVTQLNELSSSPVDIRSYVLRDVSIQKALVTPDNDDGIEVMFNLRPSVYSDSSQAPWWDFSVSSIDGEGVSRDHMVGSIAVNARTRGLRPRQTPQASQRASGKAWNQALRDVGFNYGPTFQDMEDIRFDGKGYWSSCSTNIKQQVDESLGESRYPLHPASIDSVLQLSIAAIHAGRTNLMEYGAIPIQVDEVVVWPPTEEQVKTGRASAYAWCDQRGIRNFETGAQMKAEDGELVLEINSLRCVSYEAAVPQKPQSALSAAPYGEMVWNVDFDSLGVASQLEGLDNQDLVKLALFKYPSKKILHLGSSHALDILHKNPRASYTLAVMPAAEEELKACLGGYQGFEVISLETLGSLAAASYDILVVDQEVRASDVAKAWHALKPLGYACIGRIDSAITKQPELEDFLLTVKNSEGTAIGRKMAAPTGTGLNGVTTNGVKESRHSAQLVFLDQPTEITTLVQYSLERLGWNIEAISLKDCIKSGISEHIIMITDFERPLLHTLDKEEFDCVQKIVNSTSSLLWVTTGALLEGKGPESALTLGLARAVTSEQASIDFRTIDIDVDTVGRDELTRAIVQIAQKQAAADEEIIDRESCFSHNKRYISRLVRNEELNSFASEGDVARPFSPDEDRIVGKVVGGKVMFQQEDSVPQGIVKPGHVEVRIQASGLTKEGVLVITGVDYPLTFSHEIGGIVQQVASDVTGFEPGDRVVGFHADKFANYQQIPASMLYKLESGDDLDAFVSVLTAYATAIYGLETLAALQVGERVLVLPDAGTSGVAAIKIAQRNGAIPYVVSKTAEETRFLQTRAGLRVEQIIQLCGDVSSVHEQIKHLTGEHGADVVFSAENTDGAIAREAWRSIARSGRFVNGGRKNVLRRSALDGVPAKRNACYLPVDIVDILESRPKVLSLLLPSIVNATRRGHIETPGPLHSVDLVDLNQAVSTFSDALGAPKFVVKYESSPAAPVMITPSRLQLRFDPNATYLLVGCLGGLGRSLASWMMETGARRFVFLSRSGADAPAAAKLVEEIRSAGAVVQVARGDATSQTDVSRAVQDVPAEFPIRGVVHAAMVLRDGLFHSMTFDNWKASVQAKAAGAANLHSALADIPLDFFLMMSSVSGILGNPTQSNYAAANSFLDSLARHRTEARQKAVSVILPMVLEVGVVAENTNLEHSLRRQGMYGIDEEQLLRSFELAILASSGSAGFTKDHLVVGLDPLELQKAVSDAAVTESFWFEDARLSHVIRDMNVSAGGASSDGNGDKQGILATIKSAASRDEAISAVTEHFAEKLSQMLLLDLSEIDPSAKSIASYGIDSMIGAELRKWIFKEYKLDMPFQQLLSPTLTIAKFAGQICDTQ